MVELLGSLVGDLFGAALGGSWVERARRRRTARAFADGRDVVFPGWVLGDQPYCRPAGGLLVVAPRQVYHVVGRGMPITRRDLPVERLVVLGRRVATSADHRQMPADWAVLDCVDGGARVLVACHEAKMAYVEARLAPS